MTERILALEAQNEAKATLEANMLKAMLKDIRSKMTRLKEQLIALEKEQENKRFEELQAKLKLEEEERTRLAEQKLGYFGKLKNKIHRGYHKVVDKTVTGLKISGALASLALLFYLTYKLS